MIGAFLLRRILACSSQNWPRKESFPGSNESDGKQWQTKDGSGGPVGRSIKICLALRCVRTTGDVCVRRFSRYMMKIALAYES
jgi:hypothetical protein